MWVGECICEKAQGEGVCVCEAIGSGGCRGEAQNERTGGGSVMPHARGGLRNGESQVWAGPETKGWEIERGNGMVSREWVKKRMTARVRKRVIIERHESARNEIVLYVTAVNRAHGSSV